MNKIGLGVARGGIGLGAVRGRSAVKGPNTYSELILSDSPAAYWRMDEATTDCIDSSGNGKNFTMPSAVWSVGHAPLITEAETKSRKKYQNNSTSVGGRIAISDVFNVDFFTVTAWLKKESAVLTDTRYPLWRTGQFTLEKGATATNMRGSVWVGGTKRFTPEVAFASNVNVFWALVYDGAAVRLYRDGLEVAVTNIAGVADKPADVLWFGSNELAQNNYFGFMDDVALFPQALSAGRILEQYQMGIAA